MQLRLANIPFVGVPNYRDVRLTDKLVCDTSIKMCREDMYNPENEILSKGMIFSTLSELKLFLENYAVYHHRPYSHSFKPGGTVLGIL